MTLVRADISPLPPAGRYAGLRSTAQVRRILDLGCGDGDRCVALAARPFNQVTGVDSSESLLHLARKRAARRNVPVAFILAEPRTTPLDSQSFDEVLLLGGLFGRGPTARSDVELLQEALRLLRPGGTLRLNFTDGDGIRENMKADSMEPLPRGFLYRHRTLEENGRCLRTRTIGADEECGLSLQQTQVEWLYTLRDVTDLLHRLGFQAIVHDPAAGSGEPKSGLCRPISIHVVKCSAPAEQMRGPARAPLG